MAPKLSLIFLLLFCQAAFAQTRAVISGQSEAVVGDLVVLSSGDSVGDNKVWIKDPAVENRVIECNDSLAFAVGTPGRYEFILAVADKEANIAYARHSVTIRASGPTPPPVDDPVDPDPVPPNLTELSALSRSLIATLADPPTATALGTALTSLSRELKAAQSLTIPQAKTRLGAVLYQVFLNRNGTSRDKNWVAGWQKPIDDAIAKLNPQTVSQFADVIAAIAPQASAVSTQVSKVVMYSKSGCVPCDRWSQLIRPLIEKAGWAIETRTATGVAPTFEICTNGKCTTYEGFMDANTFNSIVRSLRQ
jgi:hypothetical protein